MSSEETPRPIPPAPPRPEWLKPVTPPTTPGLTPMMDFFQRRVEALERELSLERERAQAAGGLLAQQEALKNEVDAHLKAITDQLRREKIERDGNEARSHAQGRVEALEKRLDESSATFAQLIKEAVAGRGEAGPSAGALAAELASFRAAMKDAVDGIARWRGEVRDLAALAPRVQELTERLPEDEKLLEEGLGRRIEELSGRLSRSLDDWRRAVDADRARLDERVEALARERADLQRFWEDQARTAREAERKERVAREAELAARLESLAAGLQGAGRESAEARAALERVVAILTATPKAKDEVIAALEAEKAELMAELRERHESFRRFVAERAAIEKSLGDSLARAASEVEDERARTRAADARAAELLGRVETSAARAADLERALSDRDERVRAAHAERDELARALIDESERARAALAGRREVEAAAAAKDEAARLRLDEAVARLAAAESSAAEARAQLGALAGQSARALQERDAALSRHSDWDNERRRLLEVLRKKDEMISLLSATFQGALKKDA